MHACDVISHLQLWPDIMIQHYSAVSFSHAQRVTLLLVLDQTDFYSLEMCIASLAFIWCDQTILSCHYASHAGQTGLHTPCGTSLCWPGN